MKNLYPTILLFCAALYAGFTAGEESTVITDERVESTVIRQDVDEERIADISASLGWQSKDLTELLSGIEFGAGGPRLDLTSVESLENHSCEAEATTFGHQHVCEIAAHEVFCEMSKLVVYFSISTQNLEMNAGPLSNATDEAASYVQMVSDGALPEIIEVSGATFEDFIDDPENIINLVDALKRSVPTSGIIRSSTRLAIAINKFVGHANSLLVYLGVPDLLDSFREVAQRIVTLPGTVSNFVLDNVLYPVANTLIETIAWWLMVQNNFPAYVRQVFYKYLAVAEEIVDILRAFYSGYSASGFSQIVVTTVLSRGGGDASLGTIPVIANYSTASALTLSTGTDGGTVPQIDPSKLISGVARAGDDDQPWLIPAITNYSLTLLRPGLSSSRVIDVSISGDDKLSSGESSSSSSSGIAGGTPENDSTSYTSISSPSVSSGNNVLRQYSARTAESKQDTLSIDRSGSSSLVPQTSSDISTARSGSSVKISNLSMNDETVVGPDQIYDVNSLAPSKISASSSSLSMTDKIVVASGQPNSLNYPVPSKISESASGLSMTDKTVIASSQPNPINYPIPPKISESVTGFSMTDQTVVASSQPNPINYPVPPKVSESASSLSITDDETVVASDQPSSVNPLTPPRISESSSSDLVSMTDETVVASDRSSVNSNPLDSSSPTTSGAKNVVSGNVESTATIAKSGNSFSRLIDSYFPARDGNPRAFNLGSLSSLSPSRIGATTPTCGTSTLLSSLSNLNNFLNNVSSSPLYIPLNEIASALNDAILAPGDTIVIFLRNNLGLIGRIDGTIQISFGVYRLRSTSTNSQQRGVNIWHVRSREFPSCERRIRSLFQNY